MANMPVVQVEKWLLQTVNNLYELQRKLALHGDPGNAARNVERIRGLLCEQGVSYEDPMGQSFSETRTDLDATISGASTENLAVVEVIKPVVRVDFQGISKVVQRGVVVVMDKNQGGDV